MPKEVRNGLRTQAEKVMAGPWLVLVMVCQEGSWIRALCRSLLSNTYIAPVVVVRNSHSPEKDISGMSRFSRNPGTAQGFLSVQVSLTAETK